MNTVPFTLSDVWGGFGEGAGLLHDEGNQLRVEFEVKDGVFGAIKSGLKQVVIPFDELVSVTLTKGWLGTGWLGVKIVVQTRRMDALQDVPGASQGRIELCISRKNYAAAERFVADLHENDDGPPEPR